MRLASVLLLAAALAPAVAACHDSDKDRSPGQTSFQSTKPPNGNFGGGDDDSGAAGAGAPTANAPTSGEATGREVQETDLYRLDGNRLYYLNGYRGLMVFDVTNVDHPTLLGRSPIFGSPVDMIVSNGIATVVVADWYGTLDDGSPFYGSIVRGLDATDPTNIKVLGDARLGGWVQDDRVVGNVIYAVSEDYGDDDYGWGWYGFYSGGGVATDGAAGGTPTPDIQRKRAHARAKHASKKKLGVQRDGTTNTESVIVSSVNFANKQITAVGKTEFDGWAGVFNVTPNAIMLAHQTGDYSADTSELVYLDISDPAGAIVQRGTLPITGTVDGWGADNGRWNLDFADGVTAHVIGQRWDSSYNEEGYTLSIASFANPDEPKLLSTLDIQSPGWSVVARFDTDRMYLSPDTGWEDGTDTTPFQVYDTSNSAAPKLAGTVPLQGYVWNILLGPNSTVFALGEDDSNQSGSVSLQYIDVSTPASPKVLGDSEFGQGWAWTPAAGTFKAFTMDATKGLVVLPFSGWNETTGAYNNGLQLIQFSPTGEVTAGAAQTKGWVERGIFVGTRLVSLSDLSLAVVDYTNPMSPSVISELTLARNVITAQPNGTNIAEVSSDWWDNDVSQSVVRILPISGADETTDEGTVPTATIPGIGAQVFTNGNYEYIVTSVQSTTPCPGTTVGDGCYQRAQQVQVVDVANGQASLLGSVTLPLDPWDYWGWGWYGCFWWDWWDGGDVLQVDHDALAFRRWEPVYDSAGNYIDTNSKLYIVDASNPAAPTIASTTITNDGTTWWGDMQVIGDSLFTTHYEWVDNAQDPEGWVRYYIDRIDLADRAHPAIGNKINVPGVLVGGDAVDPSTVYTVDYRWDDDHNIAINDFDVLHLNNNTATLESQVELDGWVGNTFVVGKTAYMSAEIYSWNSDGSATTAPNVELHAIDVTDPSNAIDRVASDPATGWGWLLSVNGDRALVTSGWGDGGLDIYKLQPNTAPQYQETVRTRGWWVNGVSRQANNLYLSTGYWGVQTIALPQ